MHILHIVPSSDTPKGLVCFLDRQRKGGNHVQEQNLNAAIEMTQHTSKRVLFFFLWFARMVFKKFFCSHHVLILFPFVPNDVPQVLNRFLVMFPMFPMCSPMVFPKHLTLSHIHFMPKIFPFSPMQVSQRGDTPILEQKLLFWGASQVSDIFW